MNLIKDCWNYVFVGCSVFILNKKLQFLKSRTRVWNKDTFGDIHKKSLWRQVA